MVLAGNLLSMVGCVVMVLIGFIKKKNQILAAQCFQFTFMGAGHLVLGASAGVVANAVSIVRNLIFYKVEPTWWLKLIFILAQIVFTAVAGFSSSFELLPIVAVIIFTLSLSLKSDVQFKAVIILCQVMWLVYDTYHKNYVTAAADVLTMITTVIGIVLILKNKPTAAPN